MFLHCTKKLNLLTRVKRPARFRAILSLAVQAIQFFQILTSVSDLRIMLTLCGIIPSPPALSNA